LQASRLAQHNVDEVPTHSSQSETDLLEIAIAADAHVSEFTAINMTAQKDEFLAAHNMYRCMHGAGNLVWNTAMATSAANWGASCCQSGLAHSNSYQLTPSSGENLAAGSATIAGAIKMWYDEVKDCKSLPGCEESSTGHAVGHFTAMVWSSAAQLGCAVNPTGWKGYPLYVCRYASSTGTMAGAPNMGGQYQNNVFPKSKQESQCSGSSTPTSSSRTVSSATKQPVPPSCTGSCVSDGPYTCQDWMCKSQYAAGCSIFCGKEQAPAECQTDQSDSCPGWSGNCGNPGFSITTSSGPVSVDIYCPCTCGQKVALVQRNDTSPIIHVTAHSPPLLTVPE